MADQEIILLFEIPRDVAQKEVWEVEESLRGIEGVKTELQEPKDLIALLQFATSTVIQLAAISTGAKATYDIARIIYLWLHSTDKEKARGQGKKKVVISKKGKRIELYNLSFEEVKKVLEEQ